LHRCQLIALRAIEQTQKSVAAGNLNTIDGLAKREVKGKEELIAAARRHHSKI
jgi:hypothetical protein